MKFKLQKTKLKPFHLFYIGFFVLYGAVLYYFLYYINDLHLFSVNIHFFSNVLASFSKRFLSEAVPYALIFYLLYYTKALWKRIVLISIFEILLLINALAIGFYFLTKSNFQFYILEGFNFHILFSFITLKIALVILFVLVIMVSMAYGLSLVRSKEKKVWPFKKWLFLAFLIIMAVGVPYIPILYDDHFSLFAQDSMLRKTFRIVSLEKNGINLLIDEFQYKLKPAKPIYRELGTNEKDSIKSKKLDEQIVQKFDNPPKKIVLVMVESLNQQFISHYNKQIPNTTPYLDSLFDKYPHIDDFYPSGIYTLHGVSTAVCGHTNSRQIRNDRSHVCMPELLVKTGYESEFIRGASKYFAKENLHFKKFGYESIFAKEDFEDKYPNFKKTHYGLYKTWGYSDNFIFDEAVERLKNSKSDEKLFLTLLTVDTHMSGGRCFYDKTSSDPKDPLLFSISCFDRVFKEFIEDLKNEGLFDEDLLIILTSDQLYPGYNNIPGDELKTSFILKPGKIPFLMITKKDLEIKAKQGSHIDIASTLLDLVNIKIPSYYMGKSLLSNTNTYPLGHDRQNGYMIIGNEFFSLSLNPKPFKKDDGPKFLSLQVSNNPTPKEVEALIDQKVEEFQQEQNQESALFKWYYNKFYNLSLQSG